MTRSPHYPFLQAILADPEADEPRLVYADWLDEHDPPRARAVRLNVGQLNHWKRDLVYFLRDPDKLSDRVEELDQQNRERWLAELPQIEGLIWGQGQTVFWGGLIEHLRIQSIPAFRKHADEILDAQPIYGLNVQSGSSNEAMLELLSTPGVARMGGLNLGGHYAGPGPAFGIARCPPLPNLRSLVIAFSELRDVGAWQVAQARHLKSLVELDLKRNLIRWQGIAGLVEAPHILALERLHLGWNEFGNRGAKLLAEAPFQQLRKLNLEMNKLTRTGLRALVESSWLSKLDHLNLASCDLKPSAVQLLGTVEFNRLEALILDNNSVGVEGAAGLARGEFPKLRHLKLGGADLNAQAVRSLAQTPWIGHLETLSLGSPIGDEGAEALASADLRELGYLALSGSGMSEGAIAELVKSPMPKMRSFSLEWHSQGPAGPDGIRPEIPNSCTLSEKTMRLFLEKDRFPLLSCLRLGRANVEPATREALTERFGRYSIEHSVPPTQDLDASN